MDKSDLIPTQPAPETVIDGRHKEICWYSLRGDPCPHQTCKHIHLPHDYIDKIIEAKVNEGVALSFKEASSIENELIWKLRLALRKTRQCYEYRRNECGLGEECVFLHVKGDDAKEMLALANKQKACPYQLYIKFCPEMKCPFAHKQASDKKTEFFSRFAH